MHSVSGCLHRVRKADREEEGEGRKEGRKEGQEDIRFSDQRKGRV